MRPTPRHCLFVLAVSAVVAAIFLGSAGVAAQTATTFKVATFNIQAGKGEPGLPGRPVLFADTTNCTDSSKPLNAWGVGFLQPHLLESIANDPAVIVLGLSEAWFCGSPESVRKLLGWKARSSERNGIGMVAKHGFAGPEQWFQLDTSMNPSPTDTMWVLRAPVCLDAACTRSINMFTAHWFATITEPATYEQWAAVVPPGYDRQAAQTVEFLRSTGGADPHILIGDLNTFEGPYRVCGQYSPNAGLNRLRDAGYVDAWPLIHGSAEGLTGMTNRVGCGVPEGYVWKRPDYVWSPPNLLPSSIVRFAMVTPGDASPSDHYGLIAEFPIPGTTGVPPPPPPPDPPPPPPPPPPPAGEVVLYARNAAPIAGNWRVVEDPQAAGGGRVWDPDRGAAKLETALSVPSNYFELTFNAEAGRPYRLWLRGIAERNGWANDSVHVQFSGSITQSGAPVWRIGTTSATWVNLEEASGAGLSGWGWQDNGYGSGVLGPLVYFAASGHQTLRVQTREDGFSIDQIVLSPQQYLSAPPGALKNDTTILSQPGQAPVPSRTEIVLLASDAKTLAGTWSAIADATAAGGTAAGSPDAGAARPAAALATPVNYVEFSFEAEAGRPYRLWLRGRAERDHWGNDSVFVQFSGSVNASGVPLWRIGSTDSTAVNLEDAANAGIAGWGWQDNGYGTGVLGPVVTFAAAGPQTIRIQTREDGFRIDHVVLSAERYLNTAPGALKNDTTILR